MDSELQKLIDTDIAFSKLSVEKGAAYAFSQYFIQNSIMLPQDKSPIIGIETIIQSMNNVKDILSWVPQGGKVSKSKDLGYIWGIYTITLKNGEKSSGKYVNIWSKQTNGAWKVEVDMGNSTQI